MIDGRYLYIFASPFIIGLGSGIFKLYKPFEPNVFAGVGENFFSMLLEE